MVHSPGNSCRLEARASDMAFRTCLDMIKYVEDIILASAASETGSEFENHMLAIESFFDCCSKHNLKIKISKCHFFVRRVKFLGNIITPTGRNCDDEYIKKLLHFRRPKCTKELKAFLGAIEWISKHIFGLKKLMKPLYPLLRQNTSWNWDTECMNSFKLIRHLI